MSWRTTIASRLYLIVGLALAAIAALAGVSIYFAGNTGRAAESVYAGGLINALEVSELEFLLERHRRLIEAAPLEFDRELLARDKANAEKVASRIEGLANRSDGKFASVVLPLLPGLWRRGEEVLHLADNFAQDRALAAVEIYAAAAERLQEHVRQHRHERIATADREARALVASANTLVNAVGGLGLGAALLVGPLALLLLRRMLVRLEKLTTAVRRLARNETDFKIEGSRVKDEIGEIAAALVVFKGNAVKLLDQQARLQELNRWLDIALNNMARGLSMFDASHKLVLCNSTYERMYRIPDELSLPGTPFADIAQHRRGIVAAVDDDERTGAEAVAASLTQVIGRQQSSSLRQRLVDGRTIDMAVKPLPWGGWVALHEDVTEKREATEKIARLAQVDTLTGLANRHQFQERLVAATQSLPECGGFALLAIDLDRFKLVNDTLGHPAGDLLLTEVGRRLTETARRTDIVARLGGDEFAIVQLGAQSRADAEALAQRVSEALGQPFMLDGNRAEIGGTIGISLAPADGTAASAILKNADLALYKAKSEKRGTWRFFEPEMEESAQRRRSLETDLGKAIGRGELSLNYQPIISLGLGRVVGCEALIRWRHAERGLVSPAEFIPLAEETGLINDIGAWALREACRTAALWPGELRVAVNLSAAQFAGPDLGLIAADALGRSGLSPRRLELEVTESLLLGEAPQTLDLLHRLRDLGLRIALDDFGTGYSSLSLLKSFPFDKIKIDQSFVRDLPQRRNCEAIVGAVARLAMSLDMTTVAEGVETEEHLARVRAAGCDEVQGYLFSRPVPDDQIVAVIEKIDGLLAGAAVVAA